MHKKAGNVNFKQVPHNNCEGNTTTKNFKPGQHINELINEIHSSNRL